MQGKKYAAAALGLFNHRNFITDFEKVMKEKVPNLNIISQRKLWSADSTEQLKFVFNMVIDFYSRKKRSTGNEEVNIPSMLD